MRRMDLYTMIHKGIRNVMFDAARTVARTDFGDAEEARRAAETVSRLLGLLEEHAAHEDRVVMPEIAALAPVVFSELQADHNRLGGVQREIEELCDRIPTAAGEALLSMGERLHSKMGVLLAGHLEHMDREETRGNRTLWAHRTDEYLHAMHERITGAIPPERMAVWGPILLSSVNPTERALLLASTGKR